MAPGTRRVEATVPGFALNGDATRHSTATNTGLFVFAVAPLTSANARDPGHPASVVCLHCDTNPGPSFTTSSVFLRFITVVLGIEFLSHLRSVVFVENAVDVRGRVFVETVVSSWSFVFLQSC